MTPEGQRQGFPALEGFLDRRDRRTVVAHVPELILPLFAGVLVRTSERLTWVVTGTMEEAKELTASLTTGRATPTPMIPDACWLPPLAWNPYQEFGDHDVRVIRHLATLYRLYNDPPRIVVTDAATLATRTLPRRLFEDLTVTISIGDVVDRDDFAKSLIQAGYRRAELVIEPGQFAVRGGIVDVFPPHQARPGRVDLFGDEVERITGFNPSTQRSRGRLDRLHCPPASAFVFPRAQVEEVEERVRDLAEQCEVPSLRLAAHIEDVRTGNLGWSALGFLPAVHEEFGPVSDLVDSTVRVLLDDPVRLQTIENENRERWTTDYESAVAAHHPASPPERFLSNTTLEEWLGTRNDSITVASTATEEEANWLIDIEGITDLRLLLQSRSDAEHPFRPVANRLRSWVDEGFTVHVLANSAAQLRRIEKLISSYEQSVSRGQTSQFAEHEAGIYLWKGSIPRGFRCPALGIAFVDESDLFGARTHHRSAQHTPPEDLIRSFRELNPGDFIVHRDHGIGRFVALERLQAGGVDTDFLRLEYADKATLFLPVTRIGLLQRYVCSGRDDYVPPLHKLGGTRWKTSRKKAREAAEKLASELLALYAKRTTAKGFAFTPPDQLYAQFEANFPFRETPDQERAIAEVLDDMQKSQPMDRVVCGDVGYGKTEVALRAAFKAIEDNKQVVVLVPTTILAEQHYLTMKERLHGFGIRVEQLSRFVSAAQQRTVLADARAGRVDLVVGTHRLLQDDVQFADLGLLVIDEEHRFGVRHKEKLKKWRASVDVLSLSATPIPRTLNMAMLGIRDLSTITTAPVGRQAITTHVASFRSPAIAEGIQAELDRGGQVYYVTNRIQGIGKIQDDLHALFEDLVIEVAHGQMPARKLENVMRRFIHGEIDILVTTTIVESGIDVPNANTMFIHHAERFGLAQLYQLRGRIGRSHRKAFCTFLVPDQDYLTDESRRRIGVLQRMSSLGSGLRLALEDMEIRGAGNLLGREQHGTIDAIGYDAFMDLLSETIAEIRGIDTPRQRFDTEVQIDVAAFIPDDYLPDSHERLSLYRRIGAVTENDQLYALAEEITDRYGRLPDEAQNLIRLHKIRVLAAQCGLSRVIMRKRRMRLGLAASNNSRLDPARITAFVTREGSTWKLTPDMALERSITEPQSAHPFETAEQFIRDFNNFVQSPA